ERPRLQRGPHRRLVGLQRPSLGGEDLVLRRGLEAHPLALDVLAPAAPGLEADLVATGGQRLPERDRREGVAGVAEGGEQEAEPRAQTSSASSRRIRERDSKSHAIGVIISVPTPAA